MSWGVSTADRAAVFGCDALSGPPPAEQWFRGLTVDAPRPVVFRWLRQLRVAPYSYDWVDNRGRRSPRTLTPGLDEPAVGQRWMTIFTLAAVDPGNSLTFRMTAPPAVRAFGPLTLTYALFGSAPTRLVVKMNLGVHGDGPVHWARRRLLDWPDLVMMHRQLSNLRDLAERLGAEHDR
ncbi:hypothetical protein BJ973_002619 [Actinoplanes tereljensis]|uniref:Polyketide cyclase n=1 Tax=Paractinoplanes tereljensis TaxID=571912 RepID=A0A919TVF4_9ACTN|nr:hypothetical protein [Actinoplanes tereljensis]GIF22295.1 hypothetical protein Ate02nite_50250 [Actinoplanes tereljensis]